MPASLEEVTAVGAEAPPGDLGVSPDAVSRIWDAVQRVYAVQADEELAVVEVENRSSVPFAVAFGVRPYNPEGLAVVERIARHNFVRPIRHGARLTAPQRHRTTTALRRVRRIGGV